MGPWFNWKIYIRDKRKVSFYTENYMSVVLQVYTIIKDLKEYKRSICRFNVEFWPKIS